MFNMYDILYHLSNKKEITLEKHILLLNWGKLVD